MEVRDRLAGMHMDADQFLLATSTADARNGRAAFLEKRAPEFRGD
jgi:1,4-dihydroxy-2-naphthoyl-CoA synthase